MKSITVSSLRMLSGVASMALAASAASAQSNTSAPSGQATAVQDIVVTAQKREEKLQDVPISVGVITPKLIEAQRIQNVADIAAYVPNVYVTSEPGGNSIPQYTIRGVDAGNSEPQLDNPVTLYVDGVPIGREVGSLLDLADIARIEVLRGPQGTLFGRNSTGGAVSMITSNPSGKLGIRQDFTAGNYSQFRSKTVVDLPEWNGFKLQLSYLHSQRDGDVRNLGGGTVWDFSQRSDGAFGKIKSASTLGGGKTDAFRVAVEWDPTDTITAVYKYDWTHSLQLPPASVAIADPFGLIALGGGQIGGLSRPKAWNNWFSSPNDMHVQGHNFTTTWTPSSAISVKNIFGYRSYRNTSINQIDGAGGLIDPTFGGPAGVVAGGPPNSPLLLVVVASHSIFKQLSDELQFNASTDLFHLTAGALYFRENLREPNFDSAQTIVVTDAPDFVLPGTTVPASHQINKSEAVYAQGELHLTHRLDLVAGGRWTRDDRLDDEPVFDAFAHAVHDHGTWLAGVNYRPQKGILFYGKYSTGYVPGGTVGQMSFKPETIDAVELGAKTELLDRKLQLNAATFYSWYHNSQLPNFPNGILQVLNIARSTIKGFELESTAVPLPGLTLTANLGYTDFKYTDIDSDARAALTGSPTGAVFPVYRPKWSTMLAADYALPRFSWGGQIDARIDANYRSAHYTTPNGQFPAPATWILNGRVALADIPVGGVKAVVALWGKNLTNRREITYVANLGVSYAATYEAARTVGVDVSFKY